MNTAARKRTRAWLPALGAALATAQAAALLLRPRSGVISPDPVAVGEHFSDEEVRRARRFRRPQLALGLAGGALDAALLGALALAPPRLLRGPHRRPLLSAAATAGGLSAGLTLAGLPFGALARRRALAVGLTTDSWSGWAADVAKSTAIGSGLAAGAAPLAVALMRRSGARWWLPGSAAMVGAGALFTFAAPVMLDPLFNRFSPLPPGPTREDVLELARAAGVEVGEVFEVDASRRTSAANAYVTGLGATKRVVLFDTLLRDFTREEARLVVAHELAHVRHRDVPHGLLYLVLASPAMLLAAARLTERLDRGREPGAATLAPLALSLGLVSALMGVIAAQLSRRVEARADSFALRLTDAPAPFISFEQRIVRQNLADPDPPAWITRLMSSHPPTVERIGIARAYERGAR